MEALQKYAERLLRLEQYVRPILGFWLCNAPPYGPNRMAMISPSAVPVPGPLCIWGRGSFFFISQ
jgi:hypothetical protein